ncbi:MULTISPECIES: SGNH/GDSL hydrolase family protein [unclassified Lentilitoribacter]|uniref:SGNH/GDSL hydrolase family protein n=1 Tax=unclassified Lentilitoribacter TaxID=2647570 RepID=UPI0013A6900E|nr:SGNH/GDSL hydrolase family protein [Lentilitoribacter sp. Alg239-R112]
MADIRLAMVGDSLSAGVGDGVDTNDPTATVFSNAQPITNPNWITDANYYRPGGAWSDYGYLPKLVTRLNGAGHNASIASVCVMNGATSQQAKDIGAGTIVSSANPKPTHTIIWLGTNDGVYNSPASQVNVGNVIMQVINGNGGLVFCMTNNATCPTWVDAQNQILAPYNVPTYTGNQAWMQGHPNHAGYQQIADGMYDSLHGKGWW